MRSGHVSLILGLLGILLLPAAAWGQSFGPAEWIRQGWMPQEGTRRSTLYPLGIAVGKGDEVFVTGDLTRTAYFAGGAVDSSDMHAPHISILDTPGSTGFLVRYDGEGGKLIFAQPGLGIALAPYFETRDTGNGHAIAVAGDRLYVAEGTGITSSWVHGAKGAMVVTARDLDGALRHRITLRVKDMHYEYPTRAFIHGLGLDAEHNLYIAGKYDDTLYVAPDVILPPSEGYHPYKDTWNVFVASYAPDGTLRWARQLGGKGYDEISFSTINADKAAFDVDAAGNMVLGARIHELLADSAQVDVPAVPEDGIVLVSYDKDGRLAWMRTLKDFGIAYGPENDYFLYVPNPVSLRRDREGSLYVVWRKAGWRDYSDHHSLTVGDSTFVAGTEKPLTILAKYDAEGTLLWARHLDTDLRAAPAGLEVTEEGHVYVWGRYSGQHLRLEDLVLESAVAPIEKTKGFVAHYDEHGRLVRAMLAHGTGSSTRDDGLTSLLALDVGPSGDVYLVGRYRRYITNTVATGMVILGADTLFARGKQNIFVAKYSATSLSSEPSVEMPGGVIAVSSYPNPFVDATTISYSLPEPGRVKLTVYDILGRKLAVLVDERQGAGSHSARLDASAWPNGIYLYRLEAGGRFTTGRLVHRK